MRRLNENDIKNMTNNVINELKNKGLIKKNPTKIKITKQDLDEAKKRTIARLKNMDEEKYNLGYFGWGEGSRNAKYEVGTRVMYKVNRSSINNTTGVIVNRQPPSIMGGQWIYDVRTDDGVLYQGTPANNIVPIE